MTKVNEEVMRMAKDCGICAEWYGKLRTADVDGMLEMYKDGIDFVGKHGVVPVEYLLENAGREMLHRHLIYADERVPESGNSGVYVFCGACCGEIAFSGYAAATVHVLQGASVRVKAAGLSKVFVHVYGDAVAEVSEEDAGRAFLYRHGC